MLHGPKSKHVYTSNRMLIASTNHLAHEGMLESLGLVATEGRYLSGVIHCYKWSANDAGRCAGCDTK